MFCGVISRFYQDIYIDLYLIYVYLDFTQIRIPNIILFYPSTYIRFYPDEYIHMHIFYVDDTYTCT